MTKRCLHAGKLALSKSAYSSASVYFQNGIDYLVESGTCGQNYDVEMELNTLSAEVEFCCGRFDKSDSICTAVLKESRSLVDKLPVYFTSMTSKGSRAMFSEALSLGYSVLSQLGESLPKRPTLLSVIRAERDTEKRLRQLSASDILELPQMEIVQKVVAMKFLYFMSRYAFWQIDRFSFAKERMSLYWY
jgi:predicted ATPase